MNLKNKYTQEEVFIEDITSMSLDKREWIIMESTPNHPNLALRIEDFVRVERTIKPCVRKGVLWII